MKSLREVGWFSEVAQYKSVAELERERSILTVVPHLAGCCPPSLLPSQRIFSVLMNMAPWCQSQTKHPYYISSRRCPVLQLCGRGMGSPDIPALSSSIPRDSSSLADGGCRGSSMDLTLLPASGRAGATLLMMQSVPPGAGAQAAACRVLLERAGKERPSAAMETQGTRGLAMLHAQKDPTLISPNSKSLRGSCVRLNA